MTEKKSVIIFVSGKLSELGAGTNKAMKDGCNYGICFEQEIQPNIYWDQAASFS